MKKEKSESFNEDDKGGKFEITALVMALLASFFLLGLFSGADLIGNWKDGLNELNVSFFGYSLSIGVSLLIVIYKINKKTDDKLVATSILTIFSFYFGIFIISGASGLSSEHPFFNLLCLMVYFAPLYIMAFCKNELFIEEGHDE